MSISDVLSPETFKRVVAALSALASASIEACRSYEEALRESTDMYFEEHRLWAEDTRMKLAELALLADETFDYDTNTTPKQYGIALMKRRERFCKSPAYSYFQKPKRHLPYQRRYF